MFSLTIYRGKLIGLLLWLLLTLWLPPWLSLLLLLMVCRCVFASYYVVVRDLLLDPCLTINLADAALSLSLTHSPSRFSLLTGMNACSLLLVQWPQVENFISSITTVSNTVLLCAECACYCFFVFHLNPTAINSIAQTHTRSTG